MHRLIAAIAIATAALTQPLAAQRATPSIFGLSDTAPSALQRHDAAVAPFLAMLDQTPARLVDPDSALGQIGFGDLAAARPLVSASGRLPAGVAALIRALPPTDWRFDSDGLARWRDVAGFDVNDVQRLLIYVSPPVEGMVMELAAGVSDQVVPALAAHGYSVQTVDGITALAIGEDGAMDLAAGNPGDPFRGRLGQSARVRMVGDRLHFGRDWAMMASSTQAAGAPASRDPGLQRLTQALEGLDAGPLLRALVFPNGYRIVRRAHPWQSLLLADFSTGPQSTLVVVLSLPWPEGRNIDALAAEIADRWETMPIIGRRTFGTRLGAPAVVTGQVADGLAIVRLVITLETSQTRNHAPANPAFDLVYGALLRLELNFLP